MKKETPLLLLECSSEEFFRELGARGRRNPTYAIEEAFPVIDTLYKHGSVRKFHAGMMTPRLVPAKPRIRVYVGELCDDDYNIMIVVRGENSEQKVFAKCATPEEVKRDLKKLFQ